MDLFVLRTFASGFPLVRRVTLRGADKTRAGIRRTLQKARITSLHATAIVQTGGLWKVTPPCIAEMPLI